MQKEKESPRIKNIPYQKQMSFIKPNWGVLVGVIGFLVFLYLAVRGNLNWLYAR
ncbi:MAG: hypothetical protein PVH88_19195 [Ignavibacteria bacterium]|jgi:hypothetical protein